jgi:hypothetical protein
MSTDEEHLRLLAIFHFIVGGFTALFACFPLIHLVLGISLLVTTGHSSGSEDAPPAMVGWLFIALGSVFFLVGQSLAICILLAGRFLARRTRYTFAFVVACVECVFMPFGTILGVFTILLLSKENVKQLFRDDQPPGPTPPPFA